MQGNPFSDEGRRATFDLIDYERKGEIDFKDMKEINDKLGYGYSETELLDILHAVGGYNHETITFEKFNSYIRRKVVKRKQEIAAQR
jgi:Ca2+-binding EF-hand superfamily protein